MGLTKVTLLVFITATFCITPLAGARPAHSNGALAHYLLVRCGSGDHKDTASSTIAPTYELAHDAVLYDGKWRQLIQRRVCLPSGMMADFEILSQKGDINEAVIVFVWHRRTQTTTLIREYMPSCHAYMLGLAAGLVEDKHHSDDDADARRLVAAQNELEEECRLRGGSWHRLCEPTIVDKYVTSRLTAYLCMDPLELPEVDAKPRDAMEEGMSVHTMTVPELRQHVQCGHMTIVGAWGSHLALERLREMGEIE